MTDLDDEMFRWLTLASVTLAAGCGVSAVPNTPGPKGPYDVQATAPGAAQCPETSAAENAHAAQVTNVTRARNGLQPLVPDAALAQVAAAHACDMARRGLMTHAGSRTSGPGQRVKLQGYRPALTAENIAAGPFDLNRVLREWQVSPLHIANMVYPQQRDFGIGRAIGSDGKTVFWAAVYAAPQSRR